MPSSKSSYASAVGRATSPSPPPPPPPPTDSHHSSATSAPSTQQTTTTVPATAVEKPPTATLIVQNMNLRITEPVLMQLMTVALPASSTHETERFQIKPIHVEFRGVYALATYASAEDAMLAFHAFPSAQVQTAEGWTLHLRPLHDDGDLPPRSRSASFTASAAAPRSPFDASFMMVPYPADPSSYGYYPHYAAPFPPPPVALPMSSDWAPLYFSGHSLPQQRRPYHPEEFHIWVGDLASEVTDAQLFDFFQQHFPDAVTDARVMRDSFHHHSRGFGFVSFREKPKAEQAIAELTGASLCGRAMRLNWAHARHLQASSSSAASAASSAAAAAPVVSHQASHISNGSHSHPSTRVEPWRRRSDASNHTHSRYPSHTGRPHRLPSQQQVDEDETLKTLDLDVVLREAPESQTTVYVGGIPPGSMESDVRSVFEPFTLLDAKWYLDRGFAFLRFDSHANAAQAITERNGFKMTSSDASSDKSQEYRLRCAWGKSAQPSRKPSRSHSAQSTYFMNPYMPPMGYLPMMMPPLDYSYAPMYGAPWMPYYPPVQAPTGPAGDLSPTVEETVETTPAGEAEIK